MRSVRTILRNKQPWKDFIARKTHPTPTVAIIMISKGQPKENRVKVKEHGLTFPIVLQQQWEISRRYAMFATPIAYLIDEQGIIAQDIARGDRRSRGHAHARSPSLRCVQSENRCSHADR